MADFTYTDGKDLIDTKTAAIQHGANIFAKAGDDEVVAERHNVELGAGNDTLTGNSTTLLYWNSPKGVNIDFVQGIAQDGWGTVDRFTGVISAHGTGGDDVFRTSATTHDIWVGGGHDTVSLASGYTAVVIQTAASAGAPAFSREGSGWKISYTNSGGASSSVSLDKGALVREWIGGTTWRSWDLSGTEPREIPAAGTTFAPAPNLTWDTGWSLGQWNVASVTLTEPHDAWYYPEPTDYNPPGYFSVDAHNAAIADFNRDGRPDMVVAWAVLPHTIERSSYVMPTVLINRNGQLEAMNASDLAPSLVRHFGYRTATGDFNGDGFADFASAPMGVFTRDSSAPNGFVTRWEPTLVATATAGNGFSDYSAQLEGQSLTTTHPRATFGHSLSAGDLNGDGKDDIFTGGLLWLSSRDAGHRDGTSALPEYMQYRPPMATSIGDLNGDGRNDILVLYPDFMNSRSVLINQGDGASFREVVLPAGLFGSNHKDNSAVITDVNRDGLNDIVVATTRAEPYYGGAALQIMIQQADGSFKDETAARIDNSSRDTVWGEGLLTAVDANGDGHVDLIHSNSVATDGVAIFLNDGKGNFSLFDRTNIPFIQAWEIDGFQDRALAEHTTHVGNRGFPMHINDDGIIDFVVQMPKPLTSWPQTEPNVMSLYTLVSDETAFGRHLSETLTGSAFADKIYGFAGNDHISGGAGDDWLAGGAGNDVIDGGAGLDLAVFNGEKSAYSVTSLGNGKFAVTASASAGEGVDELVNVERLLFKDGAIGLDVDGNGGKLYRLYQAVFDRKPDAAGLGYWMTQYDKGYALADIAFGFISSGEFKALYGDAPTAEQFVGKLYQNVLHREPDPGGFNFWVNAVKAGVSPTDVVLALSESAENVAQVAPQIVNGFDYIPYG